jgi:hypothetical protein
LAFYTRTLSISDRVTRKNSDWSGRSTVTPEAA